MKSPDGLLWEIDLDIPKGKQNAAKKGGNRANR